MEKKLADLIRVERRNTSFVITIDGEEFPYHTSADGPIRVDVSADDVGKVHITLIASRVEVVDDLDGPVEILHGGED